MRALIKVIKPDQSTLDGVKITDETTAADILKVLASNRLVIYVIMFRSLSALALRRCL